MVEPEISQDSNEVGPFLEDLFDVLNEAHIDYCVERNYDGLPHDLCGHDIDILISEKSIQTASTIIAATTKKYKGDIIGTGYKTDGLKWFICSGKSASDNHWGVRIDLKPCIRWSGIDYESLEDALAATVWHGRIRVQEPDRAAFFALLDNVFVGQPHFINNYGAQAMAAYQRSPEKIEYLARNTFGSQGVLLTEIFRTGRLDKLAAIMPKLKFALLARQLRKGPFQLLNNKIKLYLNYADRLLRRIGIVVAFLGQDGSGKSLLCNLVRHDIGILCHLKTDYIFLRPGLLPSPAKLMGREKKRSGPVRNPHGKPPSGLFLSLVRMAYYTLDFFIGYWLLVFPKLFRNPRVIFFDRYFYDAFWDPERLRMAVPQWIVRFFAWFVPRPDLIIMIIPNPEIFYQRKPELAVEVLKRQEIKIYEFARRQKNIVWVDTSGSIDNSRNDCCSLILEAYRRFSHGGRLSNLS